MARWLAELEGDVVELTEYAQWLPGFVVREDQRFFLTSASFEQCSDWQAVLSAAEQKLAVLTGIVNLFWHVLKVPTIKSIFREEDDGRRHGWLSLSASVVVRSKATATLGASGLTQAEQMYETAQHSSHLQWAVEMWGQPIRSWPHLYWILEAIEHYLGQVDKAGLSSGKARTRFVRTANSGEASGLASRHPPLGLQPPEHPMTLGDATAYIETILRKTLLVSRQKDDGQPPPRDSGHPGGSL